MLACGPSAFNSLPIDEDTIQSLLTLEGLSEDGETVAYLSGSLVEGFGNSNSDIDFFVIGRRGPLGGVILTKKNFSISIHLLDKRRADFEYWPIDYVHAIADQLAQIEIGKEFLAERFDSVEELFIHRLRIGIPLINPRGFANLHSSLDFDKFGLYLAQECIHRIDGALEDLSGMLDDNDLEVALFRAKELVGLAVDAYGYYFGNTNTLTKWRPKILARLPDSTRNALVARSFWTLQFPPGTALREDVKACRTYVEECIAFANRIVAWIQP